MNAITEEHDAPHEGRDGRRGGVGRHRREVGATTSIFEAGSTVPVRFELKRADGGTVAATRLLVWESLSRGGPTTAPVDESLYSAASDSGTTFRAVDRGYHYNWGTPAAGKGYYHRIGVRLDDGQTYFADIGLR